MPFLITLKYIWRSFQPKICHFHVHFSNSWHAIASHGLPAIAELLVCTAILFRHIVVILISRVSQTQSQKYNKWLFFFGIKYTSSILNIYIQLTRISFTNFQSDLRESTMHVTQYSPYHSNIVIHVNNTKACKNKAIWFLSLDCSWDPVTGEPNVSEGTASIELAHAAEQHAEFATDVQCLLTDGSTVLEVRNIPRPTTQKRDDKWRYGRSTKPFQLTNDTAQSASVAACDEVTGKTLETTRLLLNWWTICQQRPVRFHDVQ